MGTKAAHASACVIGGGPAGATLATRLALLGHAVWLVERRAFPRRHLGESLSPGVLPLLEMTGARDAIARAGFWPVQRVLVKWDGPQRERREPGAAGLLVDRSRFDQILLDRARAVGVRVLQPAMVHKRTRGPAGWTLRIEAAGRETTLATPVLIEAGGRSALRGQQRRLMGPRTIALYAYWRGQGFPAGPRIEAGRDAWYWGVPLPDGTYNTLVFVDADRVRARARDAITGWFHQLLGRSGLMQGCRDARLASRVLAADATPHLDDDCVTADRIKVGEAALALDPLSSSGVQNAIQAALIGALVVNTLLGKPTSGEAAQRFYREHLSETARRHRLWTAGHYARVPASDDLPFWRDRSAGAPGESEPPAAAARATRVPARGRLQLSPMVAFVDRPCATGAFIQMQTAVSHPNLANPVAYLGGWDLAQLLRELAPGMTRMAIGRHWSRRVPLPTGLAIADWLVDKGVLVPRTSVG